MGGFQNLGSPNHPLVNMRKQSDSSSCFQQGIPLYYIKVTIGEHYRRWRMKRRRRAGTWRAWCGGWCWTSTGPCSTPPPSPPSPSTSSTPTPSSQQPCSLHSRYVSVWNIFLTVKFFLMWIIFFDDCSHFKSLYCSGSVRAAWASRGCCWRGRTATPTSTTPSPTWRPRPRPARTPTPASPGRPTGPGGRPSLQSKYTSRHSEVTLWIEKYLLRKLINRKYDDVKLFYFYWTGNKEFPVIKD